MKCNGCGARLPLRSYGEVRCDYCQTLNYIPVPGETDEIAEKAGGKKKQVKKEPVEEKKLEEPVEEKKTEKKEVPNKGFPVKKILVVVFLIIIASIVFGGSGNSPKQTMPQTSMLKEKPVDLASKPHKEFKITDLGSFRMSKGEDVELNLKYRVENIGVDTIVLKRITINLKDANTGEYLPHEKYFYHDEPLLPGDYTLLQGKFPPYKMRPAPEIIQISIDAVTLAYEQGKQSGQVQTDITLFNTKGEEVDQFICCDKLEITPGTMGDEGFKV